MTKFAGTEERPLSYWRWLFRGRNGKSGWKKHIDRWLILHIGVGLASTVFLHGSLIEPAKTVLLPLSSVFVGMSFAWVGNAQAILQGSETEPLYKQHPGGFENYAYTFQSAILVILITLVTWGIAAMGIFDESCRLLCVRWGYDLVKGVLFFLASLSLRECWHVVMGAQLLLLAQRFIRRLPPPK